MLWYNCMWWSSNYKINFNYGRFSYLSCDNAIFGHKETFRISLAAECLDFNNYAFRFRLCHSHPFINYLQLFASKLKWNALDRNLEAFRESLCCLRSPICMQCAIIFILLSFKFLVANVTLLFTVCMKFVQLLQDLILHVWIIKNVLEIIKLLILWKENYFNWKCIWILI